MIRAQLSLSKLVKTALMACVLGVLIATAALGARAVRYAGAEGTVLAAVLLGLMALGQPVLASVAGPVEE